MAFLDITKTVLTPMQRVVLEWTGQTPAPVSYVVTLTSASPVHVVTATVSGSVTKARLGQLYRNAVYVPTIEAVFADPEDNVTATHSSITMNVKSGYAGMLRQAVYDALYDAALTHQSRNLTVLHDGYFRPVEWTQDRVPGLGFPAVEVCDPELDDDHSETHARKVQEWRVPIRLWDVGESNDPDTLSSLWLLFERVQAAIDSERNLHLSQCGVHHLSWTWQKKKGRIKGRDRASGFTADLIVPVQRQVGTVAAG